MGPPLATPACGAEPRDKGHTVARLHLICCPSLAASEIEKWYACAIATNASYAWRQASEAGYGSLNNVRQLKLRCVCAIERMHAGLTNRSSVDLTGSRSPSCVWRHLAQRSQAELTIQCPCFSVHPSAASEISQLAQMSQMAPNRRIRPSFRRTHRQR
eukprot:2707131-Pleurochrysis_carterae.AAC.1